MDKSAWIRKIVTHGGKNMLFTRPRRFGKTLTQTMLKAFLEMNYRNPADRSLPEKLFSGLEVSKDQEFCARHMGQYPVVFLSLGTVSGMEFRDAYKACCRLIFKLYSEFRFIAQHPGFDSWYAEAFAEYKNIRNLDESSGMDLIRNSLIFLCDRLYDTCKKPVWVLVDEYDAPLHKAREHEYYARMLDLVRGMLEPVVKYEYRSVAGCILTGCLRIGRESIFTGMNNVEVCGITSSSYSSLMGFTSAEVAEMLEYYDLNACMDTVSQWYNGYRFSGCEIYCPWSVSNYCKKAFSQGNYKPENYWVNSSGNEIILEFMDYAGAGDLEKMQVLLHGGTIKAELDETISLRDLAQSHSTRYLFSLLYLTGYLTKINAPEESPAELKIPDREILQCFENLVTSYFEPRTPQTLLFAEKLLAAMRQRKDADIQTLLCDSFRRHLSVRSKKDEQFYHSYIAGILAGYLDTARLRSEEESGDGFCDISFFDPALECGYIIELKKAGGTSGPELVKTAAAALEQIDERKYPQGYAAVNNLHKVICYGISCCGKTCSVKSREYNFCN